MPRGQKPGYEWKGTPKADVSPSVREIEWAAGFLEGEGCFSRITAFGKVRKDGLRPGPYYSQTVRGSQVGIECLERLQRLFGGQVEHRINKKDGREWDMLDWVIHGSRARGVMMTIYGLMSNKRKEQIRFALGSY